MMVSQFIFVYSVLQLISFMNLLTLYVLISLQFSKSLYYLQISIRCFLGLKYKSYFIPNILWSMVVLYILYLGQIIFITRNIEPYVIGP